MIYILDTDNEKVIAVKIEGKISKLDVEKIHLLIHEKIKVFDKIDFYFQIEKFKGYELKGFWEDLKVDIEHMGDYGKMAIVGQSNWQEFAANAMNFFTKSEIKYFELFEEEKAKKWIGITF